MQGKICLFILLVSATLQAQPAITSAAVAGTVRDAAGAPIAGANVAAINLDRNQKQQTVSDAAGRFRFPVLAVGFVVAVSAAAQSTTGSFLGTVTGPTGAAIPAANVVVHNTGNGQTRTTATKSPSPNAPRLVGWCSTRWRRTSTSSTPSTSNSTARAPG